MESSTSSIMVTLKSDDGKEFKVPAAVAMQAQTIRHMMELDDSGQDVVFPLQNIRAEILEKVIEYCKWQADAPSNISFEEKREWEKMFIDVSKDTLLGLILASNYLDIQALLDLSCQAVAALIMGKMPEEIRKMFKIKNDFTPEEEAEIRRENSWAFEAVE